MTETSSSVTSNTAPTPLQWGSLRLSSRYLLAPLAGFTNLPFRRICRQIGGVGLCTTDLVSARALLERSHKSMQLIETCEEDTPYAVQIFGANKTEMRDAAQFLQENGVDAIDINMGCPVRKVVTGGAGSALLCSADRAIDLVQTVVEGVSIPVSVKMRLGWDDTQITAPQFAREFEQVGIAAVTIHGRTRDQGFTGSVDHAGIRKVVEAVERIPIIGNGDVLTVADAERMLQQTGCHGISIGRGALANPWIFRQLVEWETLGSASPPGNFDERLELMLRQFGYLVDQTGLDRAIRSFRKMGNWYLKAMTVNKALRHQFQLADTQEQLSEIIEVIRQAGPQTGDRTGVLPEMSVPVPNGPVERW